MCNKDSMFPLIGIQAKTLVLKREFLLHFEKISVIVAEMSVVG